MWEYLGPSKHLKNSQVPQKSIWKLQTLIRGCHVKGGEAFGAVTFVQEKSTFHLKSTTHSATTLNCHPDLFESVEAITWIEPCHP